MFTLGKLVNGEFKQIAGNYDIMNAKNATQSSDGLMSSEDKKKLDNMVDASSIADADTIKNIFN